MEKCYLDRNHLSKTVLQTFLQRLVEDEISKCWYQSIPNLGGGWFFIGNNTTSWLHLASWDLLDSQLSWESKMEPSVAIFPISPHLMRNCCLPVEVDATLSFLHEWLLLWFCWHPVDLWVTTRGLGRTGSWAGRSCGLGGAGALDRASSRLATLLSFFLITTE